ncbi:MAG: hypothetical protein QM802_18180 [Agriterribacter sp.]
MQYQSQLYAGALRSAGRQHQLEIILHILFVFGLPALSVLIQHHVTKETITASLLGKWFILWVLGVRLLVVGFVQVVRRGRSAVQQSEDGLDLVKIAGLVKMGLSLLGFLCVTHPQWSLLPTITVGIYLGLAGFQHDFKKPSTTEGWISMIYDMVVFVVITGCLVF